jgi:DNA end-binding protein Ku
VVEDALVLEIMRFANELADVEDFSFPSADAVRPQELKMAEQLVENLMQSFDPTRYRDEYHDNLMKIIRAKMKGKELEVPEPEEREGTPVVDLMARLKESLEQGKRHGREDHATTHRAHTRHRGSRTKRAAKRRTA